MPRKRFVALCSVLGFTYLLAGTASAQNTPIIVDGPQPVTVVPQTTDDGAPNAATVQTLENGLKWVVWKEQTRGPLLVVGADITAPYQPKRVSPVEPWNPPTPLTPPEFRDGWRVETLAAYFGRKLQRVGTVSVLAPRLMTVITSRLPQQADPFAGMRSYEKMQLFQASLTEAQWRQMATNEGLGLSDLDASQRPLFLNLIPADAQLSKQVQRARWGEMISLTDQTDLNPTNREGKLTEAQRQGARLRINRSVRLWLPEAEGGANSYGAWVPETMEGTETWSLNFPGEWEEKPEAYGVKLAEEVPAKLKPGHLDYPQPVFAVGVPLGTAKTVGDLLQQISKATHQEIIADSRLARLKVWIRADEDSAARAGDLLKALALAVTGTYRRLGPAFVLTDDLEGIGTRRARIQQWQESLGRQRNQTLQEFWKRLRKMNASSFIQFANDDPLALDPKLNQKIEEKHRVQRSGQYGPDMVAINELSAPMRKLVQSAIERHEEEMRNNPEQRPVATDMVNLQLETRMNLMLPGIGSVQLQTGGIGLDGMRRAPRQYILANGRSADLPFMVPTQRAGDFALLCMPKTEDEMLRAMDAVRQTGFRQLWIQLPIDPTTGKELLTAAVKAGKQRKVAVYAVLRLMQIPRSSAKDENTLLTILGETGGEFAARKAAEPEDYSGQLAAIKNRGDWLNPADPTTLPLIKRRILEIGSIPGLAGVVLRDMALPGYERPGITFNGFEWTPFPTGDLGYNLANRLGLLRESGYDPVDIVVASSYQPGANIQLPFFTDQQMNYVRKPNGEWGPDDKMVTPMMTWNAFRYKINQKFLTDLYQAVQKENPSLRLIASLPGLGWNNLAYSPWESPEVKTDTNPLAVSKPQNGPSAKKQWLSMDCSSLIAIFNSNLVEDDTPSQVQFNRNLNQMLDWQRNGQPAQPWNGFILDFGETPVSDMLPYVLAGIVPEGSQTAER